MHNAHYTKNLAKLDIFNKNTKQFKKKWILHKKK